MSGLYGTTGAPLVLATQSHNRAGVSIPRSSIHLVTLRRVGTQMESDGADQKNGACVTGKQQPGKDAHGRFDAGRGISSK